MPSGLAYRADRGQGASRLTRSAWCRLLDRTRADPASTWDPRGSPGVRLVRGRPVLAGVSQARAVEEAATLKNDRVSSRLETRN